MDSQRRSASTCASMLLALVAAAASFVAGERASAAAPAAAQGDPALPMQLAADAAVQPGFPGMHVMQGTPGYAKTALGYAHYWSLGEGPAVLLLHGGPMFGVQFAKVMPLLAAAGYRAIAADLPGYGMSTLPDHPPTGDEYADAIVALLDALGVQRASVAGMLTGGVVTLAFATRHPARTSCVVLQHTPIYSAEELAAQLAQPAPDTRIWADGRHLTERWQARRAARKLKNASPEALQWQSIGTLLMGDPGRWWPGAGGGDYVSRSFDARRAVVELRAPTLILRLQEDRMNIYADRILALRPDFRTVALEASHAMVPYDFPEPWAKAVIGFLREGCAAR